MAAESRVARPGAWLKAAAALLVSLQAACTGLPTGDAAAITGDTADRLSLSRIADFYWPYAALATDIYSRAGASANESRHKLLLSSDWLRGEVAAATPEVQQHYLQMVNGGADDILRRAMIRRCQGALETSTAACSGEAALSVAEEARLKAEFEQNRARETNRAVDWAPEGPQECGYRDDREPAVPLSEAIREYRWQRVPELYLYAPVRSWSLFVPDLAIEVWRRPRGDQEGSLVFEYAIVYRGTVGGGGWLSNLRGLTAWTPLIWDQYHQAREATRLLVGQIYRLHALSDGLFERRHPTRIRITAVGHSLGAGLAKYIYLSTPEVTRVVGFNASPVDGAATVPLHERGRVNAPGWRLAADVDSFDRRADIFLLHEHGDALSRVAPCGAGPLWGAEGGPQVRCDSVNLSRGSALRQHNMPQLACKLFLVHRGLFFDRSETP